MFYEFGAASAGFNGITAISWSDLNAWHELSKYCLKAWDLITLHKMSQAYASQASKKNSPPPYVLDEVDEQESPNSPEAQFRALLDQRVSDG